MIRTILIKIFGLLGILMLSQPAWSAIQCPGSVMASTKGNGLYLYYPTSDDSTFPEFSDFDSSSPLADFDVADLDSGIGSTTQLRDRIFELVTDDYCEFSVKVYKTTTAPTPTETRWQIVGMGTDSATAFGGALFGEAMAVDTNDADGQDYARVWARSFLDAFGGTGEALNGTGSTLERWATAIAETTAHEAGHNYGAGHGNSAPRTGEDEQNNHLMATGSTGLTGEMRASRDRHFSDTSYEILGHNIGLNVKTLHNWDFINPNGSSADAMRIRVLSTAASLTIGWYYTGSRSPWGEPAVTNTGSTISFQGTTYNLFNVDFNVARAWSGGADGIVPAGVEFHTGASFVEDSSIIVYDVKLMSGGSNLALAPRLPGYDIGTADTDTGDFAIRFFNMDRARGDLVIENMEIRQLPRMLDINAMMRDADAVDIRGRRVVEFAQAAHKQLKLSDTVDVTIGNLAEKRHVDIVYGPEDCPKDALRPGFQVKQSASGPADTEQGELKYCMKGNALSLFPATYTYIIATVVDPNAYYWDRNTSRYVTGPLKTRVFYQVGGIVPDLNNNGVDDLIDIRTGGSVDDNQNGVPDEAEQGSECNCDLTDIRKMIIIGLILIIIIVLIVIMLLFKRR